MPFERRPVYRCEFDDLSRPTKNFCCKSPAHSLRLEVIAESVEDEAHLHFLEALGCDSMQGFYLSRSLPVQTLRAYQRDYASGR